MERKLLNDLESIHSQRWFVFGGVLELMLLAAALAGGWIFQHWIFGDLQWNWGDAGVGVLAALPLLVLFALSLKSGCGPLVEIREFLEKTARPVMKRWPVWQLGVISILAGVCEEALFRGLIQGALMERLGWLPALLIASAAFGFAHLITRTYALLAGIIGLYLGACWLVSGNLLVPIVTHAVYDFVALVYFMRLRRGAGG